MKRIIITTITAALLIVGSLAWAQFGGGPITTASPATWWSNTTLTAYESTEAGIRSAITGGAYKRVIPTAAYTLTSNLTIPSGVEYAPLPGAIVTTNYPVAGGGSNWTVHSGSVYVSTANYNEIEFLRESGTALTEVAGAADVDAAGKWAWEGNKIYVRTTGSVDPDTLGAGLLVAGHTFDLSSGYIYIQDNDGQVFSASPGEVILPPNTAVSPDLWQNNSVPGTTDMYNAIQCAIESLPENAVIEVGYHPWTYYDGGKIVIKNTKYAIFSPIQLKNKIWIEGAGDSSSIVTPVGFTIGSAPAAIYNYFEPVSGYISGIRLSNFRLENLSGAGTWKGIFLEGVMNTLDIRNVSINTFGGLGLDLARCYEVNMDNVLLNGNGNLTASNQLRLVEKLFDGQTLPLTATTLRNVTVRGGGVGNGGILIDGVSKVNIHGGVTEGQDTGLHIVNSTNVTVDGMYFENYITDVLVDSVGSHTGDCVNTKIINNNFGSGTITDAIKLDGDIDTIVMGNVGGGTTIAGVGTQYGLISVTSNSKNAVIENNTNMFVRESGSSFGFRELFFDDFIGATLDTTRWLQGGTGGSGSQLATVSNGAYSMNTGATADNYSQISLNGAKALDVTKYFTLEARIRINDITSVINTPLMALGAADRISIYFSSPVGANWMMNTTNSGSTTTVDSSTEVTIGWHTIKIIVTNNLVRGYVDGVLCMTSITDVPNELMDLIVQVYTTENVAKTMDIDFVRIKADR